MPPAAEAAPDRNAERIAGRIAEHAPHPVPATLNEATADLAARLAPIRAQFLSALGPRRDRLMVFLAAPDHAPPGLLRQLQEDAHRIRGVARTLGYDDLGQAAALADDLLSPARAQPGAMQDLLPPTLSPTLLPTLAALIGEIDAAAG
ncbi:MAG: hypothetical protein RIT14_1280 [Pseudomonadota bacterium]|jgi:HPt (histidine-containing phosphotransfer) domain-containing protein